MKFFFFFFLVFYFTFVLSKNPNLKWFGMTGLDTISMLEELNGWNNFFLAIEGIEDKENFLIVAHKQNMTTYYTVEGIFFTLDKKGRLILRPDYLEAWKNATPTLQTFIKQDLLAGFFMG